MRICILADGESIHTTRWCKHFFEQGYEIHLISLKDCKVENTTVHFIDSGKINVAGGNWKILLQYRRVKEVIRSIKPDVLHAQYATSYGLLGALTGFHPYIITPLGSDVLITPQRSFIYRILLKYAFGKADWVTSLAPHMTDAMVKLGVPKEKIGDIVFGINTDVFNKKNRKLPSDKFVITSTRNFEPVYNMPHFLKAIALVKPQIPHLAVNLIGDGSLRKELEELVKKLNIKDVVTFYGRIPQNKVVEFLNQSQVFVTVSLSDGNSLSMIEAMACGAYPIATDILANRQWVKDGINGIFVKIDDVQGLADAILKVYHNFDSIIDKAMIESDRIIAEKGTWQINMQKMDQKYKQLMSHGK